MPTPIVTVQVTQQIAPTPIDLQKTGALISMGGTNLPVGTYALLKQYSDLESLLADDIAITAAAWSSGLDGQVTLTTALHGAPIGKFVRTVVEGMVPAGYDGDFWGEVIDTTHIKHYLGTDPGVATTFGTIMNPAAAELDSMAKTFFQQGSAQSIYVMELGAGTVENAVDVLENFITTTAEQFFYSYLVPRSWDADASFIALLSTLQNPTSKTYFFVTTTLSTMSAYTELMKNVVALVEAPNYGAQAANVLTNLTWALGEATGVTTTDHDIKPGEWFQLSGTDPAAYGGWHQALDGTTGTSLIYSLPTNPGVSPATLKGQVVARTGVSEGVPPSEFTLGAAFYVALNYAPGPTNRVPPYAFSFLYGVTAFPTFGNASLVQSLKDGNLNYVGTGAEGGISNTMLLWGHTMDGRPFNYWYSVDYMQIHVNQAIANAIINGSNTTINPLYYNQDGINRLQDVVANVGANAISFGLAVGRVVQVGLTGTEFNNNLNAGLYAGNVVINAVPFAAYVRAVPGDYKIGHYGGMSMVYTPQRGFESILFNIVVTDFIATAV